MGGKALAAKIIADHIKAKIDPLGEENIMVLNTCPLTNTSAPCSARFNISSISPLTGLLASSNCGGNFGNNLKRAGYDGLVIVGKAKRKILIEIECAEIKFSDATHLWGKTTGETQELIGGKRSGRFVIGPAGENLVKYAGIFSQERTAGRTGLGAVFGSKNLKGLVVSGMVRVEMHDQEAFKEIRNYWTKLLRSHPTTGEQLPQFGTMGLVTPMHYRHLLSTKNYSKGQYEHYSDVSGEALRDKYLVKNKGCETCPIQCARVVKVEGKDVKGPEVETAVLLGSNLCNNDMQSMLDANYYCDEYGLDTISFGSSIGFAMELNEKGLWDCGLEFGQKIDFHDLIRKVAYREGIGNEIAEGTKRMAQKFGGEEFAINVKGLELAAYEPRAAQGMGLGYATGNRGGCHINGGYMVALEGLGLNLDGQTIKGKTALSIFFQNTLESISTGGSCIFTSYAVLPAYLVRNPNSIISRIACKVMPHLGLVVGFITKHPRLLCVNMKMLFPHVIAINAVIGSKLTIGKYLEIGTRGFNLERLINTRLGLTAKDDKLPKRLTHEPEDPNNKHSVVKLDKMKSIYYRTRGWDQNGVPKAKTLKKLGIEV